MTKPKSRTSKPARAPAAKRRRPRAAPAASPPNEPSPDVFDPWAALPERLERGSEWRPSASARTPPPFRRLRVYSADPGTSTSLSTLDGNIVTLQVPWESRLPPDRDAADGFPEEHELQPGPVGEYLEVIDFDPASGCYYDPVNLNDPALLAQDGLMPSEGDPQFHQQMVYAVAMNTIRVFERAMGRRVQWSARIRRPDELTDAERQAGEPRDQFVRRLRIYPHAFREANAFYSPDKKALLFGYFQAGPGAVDMLPGGMVFTCLAHDVIAHELTHAILDGLQEAFLQPLNPDVLAFHEGFADIVALLQRCTFPEVVRGTIRRFGGDLRQNAMLGELAGQFGRAVGLHGGLRSAIGTSTNGRWIPTEPDPERYRRELEPHHRGALLVAAVFDAFTSIYRLRTADLVRLATGGTGVLPNGELHPDLVNRLTAEVTKSARHVLTMCIRAIDYLPPVDVTFGDYLRAIITADQEAVPDDGLHYRIAIIEAFRKHGLYPLDVLTMSEDLLVWRPPEGPEADAVSAAVTRAIAWAERSSEAVEESFQGKPFRGLAELVPKWNIRCERREVFDLLVVLQQALHEGFAEDPGALRLFGIDPNVRSGSFRVRALRPIRRAGQEGESIVELVFSIVQRDENNFYGGSTVVLNAETGRVRYIIRKDIASPMRRERWRRHCEGQPGGLAVTYMGSQANAGEPFAALHEWENNRE